jgi:Carboxypeptidase regulatory-like domain
MTSRVSFSPPLVRHVGPLLLSFMFVSTMPLLAQQTAALSGTLEDSSKYPIEGASVTLRNTGSNEIRQSLTDSTGRYTFTLLQAGTFEVTGDKAGFKESTRPGINLAVGQSAVVDLQLMPGPASEQVFVNGDASQIGATLNETSGLITGEQVRNLPLNGRSYDELITLNPGSLNYTAQRTGGVGTSNSAVGNMFAISGRRPQENLFLLDGVEYTGASGLNQTPGGTSGLLLGVDSLREFNVLTNTYSAAYGKRPGAQVLLVANSGTNQFHGSVSAQSIWRKVGWSTLP